MAAGKREKNSFHQMGAGLIEVLITLLVIAVGVLGMVGLQSTSLQHNQTSYLRSQASFLASDMMERIRANRSHAAASTAYSVLDDEYEATACDQDEYPDQCETGVCSRNELAKYDLKQWKFNLACHLPDGKGSIAEQVEATGKVFVIRISFNDTRGHSADRVIELRGTL